MAEQQKAAHPRMAVTGEMARALAAHGYQVRFPPGRDPAVFTVTGPRGGPTWK